MGLRYLALSIKRACRISVTRTKVKTINALKVFATNISGAGLMVVVNYDHMGLSSWQPVLKKTAGREKFTGGIKRIILLVEMRTLCDPCWDYWMS